MAGHRCTDEELAETVAAYNEHGSQRKVAAALGLSQATIHNRLKQAGERGLLGTGPVISGFRISQTTAVTNNDGEIVREFIQQRPELGDKFEVPANHTIKGISALVDPDDRVMMQWIKTREEPSVEATIETIKAAFADYEGHAHPLPAPLAPAGSLLTLYPCNDWHVGMYAWGREAHENWDTKIAEKVIGGAIEEVVERSPSSGQAVVLGGGDLFHADNMENRTAKSGHALDVDGRYQRVLKIGCRLMVRAIDAVRRHNDEVIVRILPGNHDEHSAVAAAYFLMAWYRNEPRVTIDVDPSLFWWHRFGSVMFGATHGHTVKIQDMAASWRTGGPRTGVLPGSVTSMDSICITLPNLPPRVTASFRKSTRRRSRRTPGTSSPASCPAGPCSRSPIIAILERSRAAGLRFLTRSERRTREQECAYLRQGRQGRLRD